MPLRKFKVKDGRNIVSKGPYIAPLAEGTTLYEMPSEDTPHGIKMLKPHVRVTMDGSRDPDCQCFYIPDEDIDTVE